MNRDRYPPITLCIYSNSASVSGCSYCTYIVLSEIMKVITPNNYYQPQTAPPLSTHFLLNNPCAPPSLFRLPLPHTFSIPSPLLPHTFYIRAHELLTLIYTYNLTRPIPLHPLPLLLYTHMTTYITSTPSLTSEVHTHNGKDQ